MIGGAEHSLATLLRHLDEDIRVEIIAADPKVGDFLARQRPVDDLRIVPFARSLCQIGDAVRLIRTIAASKPDVLHVNQTWLWARPFAILGGLLARGTRVVVVEHSQPPPAESWNRLASIRWVSGRLGAQVAVGEHSARRIEEYVGLSPGSVRVIHNGVEVNLEEAPRAWAGPSPTIGAIGRISPEKGYDDLPALLSLLPQVHAVIVGEGPEQAQIEELAAARGVADRLQLAGWQQDVRPWLSSFDVLVAPSRAEGLPLGILEAMMAGVPVVATDVGSVSEAVRDRETGRLVPPEDPDALAAAVKDLLDDAELRKRVVHAARQHVLANFTAAAMAERYEALYGELLAS